MKNAAYNFLCFASMAVAAVCLGAAGAALYCDLECVGGCACKSGGECRCFTVTTAKCQCSNCNCEPEQVLTPLSEQEFEELKAALKKEIAARKKKCCASK